MNKTMSSSVRNNCFCGKKQLTKVPSQTLCISSYLKPTKKKKPSITNLKIQYEECRKINVNHVKE